MRAANFIVLLGTSASTVALLLWLALKAVVAVVAFMASIPLAVWVLVTLGVCVAIGEVGRVKRLLRRLRRG